MVISVAQQTNGAWSSAFVSSASTAISTSTTTYDAAGRVTQAVDAAGHTVTYQYDKDARQIEVDDTVNGVTRKTQSQYDAAGRLTESLDALGNATQSQYDAGGNLVKTVYADGTTSSATYDFEGRKISSTDQLGQSTGYQYDNQGRLVEVQLPAVVDPAAGDLTQPTYLYGYDNYGDRSSITDALGRVSSFAFDQLGHQVGETLPAVSGQPTLSDSATYNSLGQLATSTDYKGQVVAYTYDNQGRVLTKKYYASQAAYQAGTVADQSTYGYDIYDSAGRHDTVTDSTGTTDMLYDVEGRLIKVSTPQGVINYAYDPATGEHIETSTANSDIKYAYDQEQRLTTVTVVEQNGVTLSSPEVTAYAYDLNNNLISTQLPNGVTTTDTYDALNRLTKEVHDNALGQLLSEYDYTLLANGMRSSVKETELESDGTYSTRTFDWVYDALGRLTQEQLTSTLAGESYTDDYTYNVAGDRLELRATAANGTVTDTKSTYNALDQLTQDNTTVSGSSTTTTTNYGYGDNGSLISKVTVGGDSYQYTYNVRNELASATISRTEQGHSVQISTAYKYNDAGIRVESDETTTIDSGTPTTATKLFLIDGNNPTGYAQVLEQLAAVGGKPVVSYMLGNAVIGQTTATGAAQYILADGHASTRLLTDANAAILARFLYDAYGNILGQSFGALNLPATAILYTGQQFDPLLLQYYLRARYYDPVLGLFSAIDPFAGNPRQPATLNHYDYAGADPIQYSDPSGQLLGGFAASLSSWAFNLSYSLSVGGVGAEVLFAISAYSLWEDLMLAGGLNPEAGIGQQAAAIGFLAFDVTPVGKVVRRVIPGWTQADDYVHWLGNLIADHSKEAITASRRAMTSALMFSEDIVEGTLKVTKSGGAGADIVAEAVEGGVQGVLKREVSVFGGSLSGLYGKITNEANQAKGATFPQVFIEVTDDVLAQSDALQTIRQKAQNALHDMKTVLGFGENSKVFVVDSRGKQLFPVELP